MKLVLDLGNTRSKWGLVEERQLKAHGIVSGESPDRATLQQISLISVCSVIGAEESSALLDSLEQRGLAPGLPIEHLRTETRAGGVVNLYDNPDRLGVDRWLALVAARARSTDPTLVVLAGTATTIDMLNGEGEFIGGLIVPGLNLMIDSLAQGTHGIGQTKGQWSPSPRSTADAVYSGALQATLGALFRQYEVLARQSAKAPRICLSGGAAPQLADELRASGIPLDETDTLVLEGMARLF